MKTIISLLIICGISTSVLANEELAKSKGCLACHNVDKKIVGPTYKEIAVKYQADKKAPDLLAKKIQAGGSGTWGTVPMPPNKIGDDEAKKLATWILTLK